MNWGGGQCRSAAWTKETRGNGDEERPRKSIFQNPSTSADKAFSYKTQWSGPLGFIPIQVQGPSPSPHHLGWEVPVNSAVNVQSFPKSWKIWRNPTTALCLCNMNAPAILGEPMARDPLCRPDQWERVVGVATRGGVARQSPRYRLPRHTLAGLTPGLPHVPGIYTALTCRSAVTFVSIA